MALIAPGAFLWLTFFIQCAYGAPMAAQGMWIGIVAALVLCLATAISYAELSKLYPGAGSSYFFAEQAFLSKKEAFKWARLAKFMVGWASHLYYWVYPGLMVGTTSLVAGYMLAQFFPDTFNPAVPSPIFMIGFCVVFAPCVAYIAFRGVGGTTVVNAVINVVQITALIIFSVMAISYRVNHTDGSKGIALDANGVPSAQIISADGKTPPADVTVSYAADGATKAADGSEAFQYHKDAISVISPHKFSYVIIQACVAILILVGFESVTSMGEEAKNAKRDIPKAVILSLLIQGAFCYLLEYFAANFFLHNNYNVSAALGSAAPIGDMMKIVGMWAFGSAKAGQIFMLVQATTVLLALVGTTLSCMTTGARVTYAMGRDEEMGEHFGMLHGKNNTPHRAIWTLAFISIAIGIISIYFNFCGPCALSDDTIKTLPVNVWYKIGVFGHDTAAKIPQSLLVVTLVSNFGTFLLYMMTCFTAIVAFREHHTFNTFKHTVVPVFGLLANLLCMVFFIVGPFSVPGMSKVEPFVALGIVALWGVYGAIYMAMRSKKTGRTVILSAAPTGTVGA